MFLMYNGDMAESLKGKRAIFPKGEQKKFILDAKNKLDLKWKELSVLLKISAKSLRGWRDEKNSMTLGAVKAISKSMGKKKPVNIEIKDRFWYVYKGAKKGGLSVYKKYGIIGGDQEKRKERWRKKENLKSIKF